jgi:alanine dehydrogenase
VKVGVAREVENRAYRVALTPSGVTELRAAGHDVLVEHDPGTESSIPDADPTAAGANVVGSADDVWGEADLLLEVEEPIAEEYGLPSVRWQEVLS